MTITNDIRELRRRVEYLIGQIDDETLWVDLFDAVAEVANLDSIDDEIEIEHLAQRLDSGEGV